MKVLNNYNKSRHTNIVSHVKPNKSNNFKSPNINYVTKMTNTYFLTVKYGSSSNPLINFPKKIFRVKGF